MIRISTDEAIYILEFGMSFGHKPTAKETLEILNEHRYAIVKMSEINEVYYAE